MTDPVYNVALKYLKPYSAFNHTVWRWIKTPITREEIELAIQDKRFYLQQLDRDCKRKTHISRIAYMVVNWKDDPIDIDIGVPSITGYQPNWIIQDGNHRLAAAFYLKKRSIKAYISGQCDLIEKMFNVRV